MSESMVILTGAGISAESGLSTFRDRDGIWSRVRVEDVATPEAFARNPEGVLDFYRQRLDIAAAGVVPNPAHYALARLEREYPGRMLLVTQNIDDLHEQAGSERVLHMHGRLRATLCAGCGRRWPDGEPSWRSSPACPACGGGLRPDVVWFGEEPYGMPEIAEALATCRWFVSIGTSGMVYPAAGFVAEAAFAGARCVELNLEPSEGAELFDEARHGPASEIVPAWTEEVLAAVPAL